ncbi:35593_t:CDS:1, partial [Racocetra persica]
EFPIIPVLNWSNRIMATIGGILTLVGTNIGNETMGYIGGGIILSCPFVELCASYLEKKEGAKIERGEIRSLVHSIEILEVVLKPFLEDENKFQNRYYYYAIRRVINVFVNAKEFLKNVVKLSDRKKFLNAKEIRENNEHFHRELDDSIRDLNLVITIASFEKKTNEDTNENIDTILQEIVSFNKKTNEDIDTILQEIVIIKNSSTEQTLIELRNKILLLENKLNSSAN